MSRRRYGVLMLLFLLFFVAGRARVQPNERLTQFVNPFIGTAGYGHTFPGAVRPWGMVSVSPHNAPGAQSGYRYGEPFFYGFGQVHLSGTGCAELGSIIVTALRGEVRMTPEAYRCHYGKEVAETGYYAVDLIEPAVRAETSANMRSGIMRFTPQSDGELKLLFDVGRNLSLLGGGRVSIVSKTEVEGVNIGGGFCGESNRHQVYFYARFDQTATDQGIWVDEEFVTTDSAAASGTGIGSWFEFNVTQDQPVLVKIGISYVSTENARENLETEIPDWNFEQVRHEARADWERVLSRIRVEGGSAEDKTKFYTALYHMFIHPNIISDISGDYPLMGRTGVGNLNQGERYTVFSLWDTYRTLHPFLTLVYPERQIAMVRTMVDMYRESGFLPKWELVGNETYMMVGDPATIVIADTYIKGLDDFDVTVAYEGMRKPTDLDAGEKAPPIRPGYHEQVQYGYIPFEQDTSDAWWVWGPLSTSLEYCLADWAIARTAEKMGRPDEAEEFFRRAKFYRNYFDASTQFLRPKLKNGDWLQPFDPLTVEGSGPWKWSGGPGYVEGNAWHYSWFVPHDVPGLIELFGREGFINKLQRCFDEGHFTIGNEPDIAYPYLFTYVEGEEWRTEKLMQQLLTTRFGTDADGLPGDDDAGAISAWFVWGALGLYPACPAADDYRLGLPLFEKITLRLNSDYYPGNEIVIEKVRSDIDTTGVGEVRWNGESLPRFAIEHEQLVSGGKLQFITSNK